MREEDFLIQFTFCTRDSRDFQPARLLTNHCITMFTGSLRVKVIEAKNLKPTDYQKRHELNFGKNNDKKDLDPYVSLNVDEKFIGE